MSNVNSPNLGSVFSNATVRKTIYGVYVVAAIIVGGAAVYFASIGASVPEIVVGAQAVIAYLAIPVGGLAVANTTTKSEGLTASELEADYQARHARDTNAGI